MTTCKGSSSNLNTNYCKIWQDLYDNTNGSSWTECSDKRNDPCSCKGVLARVSCSEPDFNFIQLNSNNLNGTLPDSIGNINEIAFLQIMSNDNLRGPIPSSLGKLTSHALSLADNHLTGTIPSALGNITPYISGGQVTVTLNNNNLTGSIPPSVTNSKIALEVSNNSLTGPLPAYSGNMKLSANLFASNNNLTGSIPESLGKYNISNLYLEGNNLTGSIPDNVASALGGCCLKTSDNTNSFTCNNDQTFGNCSSNTSYGNNCTNPCT